MNARFTYIRRSLTIGALALATVALPLSTYAGPKGKGPKDNPGQNKKHVEKARDFVDHNDHDPGRKDKDYRRESADAGPGNGPPPWAPAHGRRAKYAYRYYPSAEVYFEPEAKVYYWRMEGEWRHGHHLPDHYHLDTHVTIEMDVPNPFEFHEAVRRWYH